MINTKSLVLYKKQPAVVTETGDKYTIEFCTAPATPTGKKAQYATQKVRDKDIILLHEGAVSSLQAVLDKADNSAITDEINNKLTEAWELLISDDATASEPISVKDLAELSVGSFEADIAWAFYKTLLSHTNFAEKTEEALMFIPRTEEEIEALKKKLYEKEHEADIRAALVARLKEKKLDLPGDAKYMQEVEALALGQTDKSKLMKEAGFKESPEKAHKLLLDTGIWTIFRNPHPSRRGLSMQSATEHLPHPPENEERLELDGTAWAIDNAWSTDPDDAISYDGTYLWVHIADPASTVQPDSKIDITARNRGSTLYIPEGASRMLSEESLEDYALGLCEYKDGKPTGKKSKALSFRLRLDENGAITDSAVIKTLVHVERLTYEQADERRETPELAPLFEIAERNEKRRMASGAVSIELPEVHISLNAQEQADAASSDAASGNAAYGKAQPEVTITPSEKPLASGMIREMMLLAGEAAAKFAFKNGIPFPFVSQEKPDIPKDIPAGLAGQYRLRRSMRSRSVGVTPSQHAGLGLGMYSQVTSPLRRYSDLIAHIQLRAFLDGRELLDKDTMLERISAGDAAAGNASKAERESNMHWTLVYLRQHPDWTGTGVAVEIRGKQAVFLIPELAQETLITPRKMPELNDTVTLKAGNINIPELSVTFQEV